MSAYCEARIVPISDNGFGESPSVSDAKLKSENPLHNEISASMALRGGNGVPLGSNGSGGGAGQITTSQRMISATWGSLLTGLLVTPLDVVRVRLQSQSALARAVEPLSTVSPATAFKELPPNLGVTACCREVFWIGDNVPFCIVGQGAADVRSLPSGAAMSTPECMVEQTQRKTFTSTLDGLQKIARHEGFLSLWRGLSPTLVMAIPANVIYFTGYDWLRFDSRSLINRHVSDSYAPLVAGSVARIAAASTISPIEMFRTRLQATSGTSGTDHFMVTFRGLHQMTQSQGYSSLWRGLTLTMWRDVPFSGLYWWGYEGIRKILTQMRSNSSLAAPSEISRSGQQKHTADVSMTFIDSFTAGALSGYVAALITTPFDVGKTRQQVFRHAGDIPKPEPHILETTTNPPPTTTGRLPTNSGFKSSSFTELMAQAKSGPSFATSSGPASTISSPSLRPEQLSIPRFLLHIYREEGLPGLFRGWAARCLKVAPACAIMISSYEVGKKMALQVNEHRGVPRHEGDNL